MKRIDYKIIIYVIILIVFQCFSYYIAKFTPFDTKVLASAIDQKIPFITEFVYFYIGWYLMLLLVPLYVYIKDKEKAYKYIVSTFLSLIVATFIFVFYPTIIIRPEITYSNLSSELLNLIYFADTPACNCLPSVHCIICFMFIYILFRNKSINTVVRIVLETLSILVILSTLFTKQHVLIDVVFAFIVSISCYFLVSKTNIYKVLTK